MEGGRVNHCRCMGIVGHSHGWLGEGMEVVVDNHAGQSQDGLVACQGTPENFPKERRRH